jgi:hypothetical protein
MKDQIDYIMDNFNFERVHVAMAALDWTWVDHSDMSKLSVPTVSMLRKTARRLLNSAADGQITTASGGFYAKYCPPEGEDEAMLVLSFVLAEFDSEYYND